MLDITPLFDELLRKRSAPPSRKAPPSVNDLDDFIKEAYRINTHILRLHSELKDVRQAYLSTAAVPRISHNSQQHHGRSSRTAQNRPLPAPARHLTDGDREEIDATAKKTIRELNAGIRALDEAESLRRATEAAVTRSKFTRGFGALSAWAAGAGGGGKSVEHKAAEARAREVAAHRDGVLLFLRQGLEKCCATQRQMMERRLTREVEKNMSVLAKAGGGLSSVTDGAYSSSGMRQGNKRPPGQAMKVIRPTQGLAAAAAAATMKYGADRRPTESGEMAEGGGARVGHTPIQLSQQQMVIFEKSNQDMMTAMEAEMVKIQTAQQSLAEISELQTTLMGNLEMQAEHIDVLAHEQEQTEADVRGGNRELKAATERGSTARATFYVAAAMCAFSIVCNLIW